MIQEIKRVASKTATAIIKIIKTGFGIMTGTVCLALIIAGAITLSPVVIIFALISGLISILMFTPFKDPYLYRHQQDIRNVRRYYRLLIRSLKKGRFFQENPDIKKQLKENLKKAGVLNRDLNNIVKTLSSKEWNPDLLKKMIVTERKKAGPDNDLLSRMEEKQASLNLLTERENNLRNLLSAISINIQNIYSKVTLLDTRQKHQFDEIETEIKRILDKKLTVEKYEEQLKNDPYSELH